jgi:ABC-type transporter Mla maintaining outer membrane lipid asymmetry ATPase subunit MlaF
MELRQATVASLAEPHLAAVESVDWTIGAGEFWVLAGLPGSGKSGLLATAAGLLPPLSGAHRLFGCELEQSRESDFLRQRLRAGFVFGHGGRLFQDLTLAQNVALPLAYHGDENPDGVRDRALGLLAAVGLEGKAGLTPARLSRADCQRAALARALALQPELLLLDDPLSGLNPREVRWWIDFLIALAAGHEALNGCRATLAVACEDVTAWLPAGSRFALIKDRGWHELGPREHVIASREPLLRDLTALTNLGE